MAAASLNPKVRDPHTYTLHAHNAHNTHNAHRVGCRTVDMPIHMFFFGQ